MGKETSEVNSNTVTLYQNHGAYLTERAYTLREDYEAVSARMGTIFYEGFNEEEIRLFESFLRRVLDNLEGGQ